MLALRSRRLESMFDAPLDGVTATHVESLVANQVVEAFDLDFKQSLYGRSDAAKRELASDVASLANTAGGVILVGVAEDEQAGACAAPGVEISDAETARMLQIVASGVSPMPLVDIVPLPIIVPGAVPDAVSEPDSDSDEQQTSARGFYLIAVPRSPAAPHAVLVNEGLRFPKRNGSTTRYLSEPEVAAAYRDRALGAAAQSERLGLVEAEAVEPLDRRDKPWLVVALVPDTLGDMDISHESQRAFEQQTVQRSSIDVYGGGYGTSFQRARVGRRRFLADGSSREDPKASYVSAEFHTDGAGAYSLDFIDSGRRQFGSEPTSSGSLLMDDEVLAISMVTALRRLGVHSRDSCHAGGNALVRAQVVCPDGRGVEIGHSRNFGGTRSKVALTGRMHPAETITSLDDLASPGPALIAVAARLIDEVAQSFGIPELGQLTREGEIRVAYWSQSMRPPLVAWADQYGVALSDSTLES